MGPKFRSQSMRITLIFQRYRPAVCISLHLCNAIICVALHQRPLLYLPFIKWPRRRSDPTSIAVVALCKRARTGAGRRSVERAGPRPIKDDKPWLHHTTSKAKPKPASGPAASAFELPKFEMPNFEVPKMEIPAAFREIAEKSVSQAKETYEKMKSAAEEATDVLEDTYATATKGASDYGLKVIEVTRANTNAAFDFYSRADGRDVVLRDGRTSTAHARKQFETATAQGKELAALAQKVATETAEPIKDSVTKAFKKVA